MSDKQFEAPQPTINPQWAMNMIQSQYDNVGIDRVLSVREDFEGDLFITILLTNGNKQQLIIEKSMIGMDVTEDYEKWGAEEFEADNCEGKKLKDSGYCNLNFDWSSSGLSRSCQTCGNEEFMDEYWDSQRISMSEPEEGKILCSMTEWNGGRDENDLGYCSFDFNYGSDGAFSECEFCGTEVMATFDNSFYDDDDDDDDDEFESEFSKGDMLNLKKYIDYPMRWIDKNIRPSSDAKVRKIEQKSKGQIPTKKTTDSFRQKIETPNWFKAVQVGILASVVGVMYFKDSGAIEEPEEPEEQKEE
jgi:hypothetical protein